MVQRLGYVPHSSVNLASIQVGEYNHLLKAQPLASPTGRVLVGHAWFRQSLGRSAVVAVGSHSYAGAWINGSNSFSGASGIATPATAANVFFQQSLGCLVSVAPLVQELLGVLFTSVGGVRHGKVSCSTSVFTDIWAVVWEEILSLWSARTPHLVLQCLRPYIVEWALRTYGWWRHGLCPFRSYGSTSCVKGWSRQGLCVSAAAPDPLFFLGMIHACSIDDSGNVVCIELTVCWHPGG